LLFVLDAENKNARRRRLHRLESAWGRSRARVAALPARALYGAAPSWLVIVSRFEYIGLENLRARNRADVKGLPAPASN